MSDKAAAVVVLAAAGAGLVLLTRKRAQEAAAVTYVPNYDPAEGANLPQVMNAFASVFDVLGGAAAGVADQDAAPWTWESAVPQSVGTALDGIIASAFPGVAGPAAGSAGGAIPPAARSILDVIGNGEAPRGYDQVYGGIPHAAAPPRPITSMSVREVYDWQGRAVSAGAASTAAGRYQIIRGTLRGLAHKLDAWSWRYDPATQDRFAFELLRRRGWDAFVQGRKSLNAFGNDLAKEWAALPVLTGSKRGRSYYHGDGLNAARVPLSTIVQALKNASGSTVYA